MYTVENRIGRLVEVRLIAPMGLDEVPGFGAACKHELGRALRRQSGKLAVVCTDLRAFAVLSPDLFGAITVMMRGNNIMCERTGQLTQSSAVGTMQADRAVREAGVVDRRNFNQVDQIVAFLSEVLSERETERMVAFLAEFKDKATTQKEHGLKI